MTYLTIIIILLLLYTLFKKNDGELSFSPQKTLPLRGFLALCIILHHIALKVGKNNPESILSIDLFRESGALVVAVFFFMSGYGLMKSLQLKGRAYLKGFLQKRLSKIVIPLLLCTALFLPVNIYLLGNDLNAPTLCDWNVDYPFLPTEWYAVTIVIFYIAFYVIAKILKSNRYITLAMLLFSFLYIYAAHKYNFYDYWYNSVLAVNVGMLVSLKEDRIIMSMRNYKSYIVSLALTVWVTYFFIKEYIPGDVVSYPLSKMMECIFVVIIAYIVVSYNNILDMKLFDRLGNLSYEIYLVQGAIILILFSLIGGNTILFGCMSIVLSISIGFVVNSIMTLINRK